MGRIQRGTEGWDSMDGIPELDWSVSNGLELELGNVRSWEVGP